VAENIYKITGDLLFYTSSPVNEFELNDLQYGSTIMPAKKNPVILEFSRGLSIDIMHNCRKISDYSRNSQLQLNPYLPFIASSFEQVFNSLFKMIDSLYTRFFSIIDVNLPRVEENLMNSKALLNSLLPFYGYNRLKELYLAIQKLKPRTWNDLKHLLKDELNLSESDFNMIFDRKHLTSYKREK
jgi:aspartate ammonia-lyase